MSFSQSVADTNLGLTASEVQLFRQQQQIVAQGHAAQAQAGRGRGQSRSSNPSSRAASAASSQGGQGRVFLDPGSLQRLHAHFENLMRRIQERITDVSEPRDQIQHTTDHSHFLAIVVRRRYRTFRPGKLRSSRQYDRQRGHRDYPYEADRGRN